MDVAVLVSWVHSHTSSVERHADGPAMTEEDDCVITQVQEHVELLVKFNIQTSQFQMFQSLEWRRSLDTTHCSSQLATYLSYITSPPSSTLQNWGDVECRRYWTCTCYVRALIFLVQKQGLCVIIRSFKNIIASPLRIIHLIITSLEVESKQE